MDKIIVTQDSKWHILKAGSIIEKNFSKGQEIYPGKDVPLDIAKEMISNGYAYDPAEKERLAAEEKAKAEEEEKAKAEVKKKNKGGSAKDPAVENKSADPVSENK